MVVQAVLTVDHDYLKAHRDTLGAVPEGHDRGQFIWRSPTRSAPEEVLARSSSSAIRTLIELSYANFKSETPLNAEIDPAGAENILATLAPRTPVAISPTISTPA